MKTLQKLLAISEAQTENITETIQVALCFVGFENIKENSAFSTDICDPDPDGSKLCGDVSKYNSLFGNKFYLKNIEKDSGAFLVLNLLLYRCSKKMRSKLAFKLFRSMPMQVRSFLSTVKSDSYLWIEQASLSHGLFDFSTNSYDAYLLLKKQIEQIIVDEINILYLDEIQDFVNEND